VAALLVTVGTPGAHVACACPAQGAAASGPAVPTTGASDPLESKILAIWRQEAAKASIQSADIETYARFVRAALRRSGTGIACVRTGKDLRPYRMSLRRVLAQYASYLAQSDTQEREGILRWLAWCTVEALTRKEIPFAELDAARRDYASLYADIIAKVRENLLRVAGSGLAAPARREIEDCLQRSARAFDRRVEELQVDYLYPGMKTPLTPAQRAAIASVYDNPRLYPPYDVSVSPGATRDDLFVSGAKATISQFDKLALFDILQVQIGPVLLRETSVGWVLQDADSVDGYWPALIRLRPLLRPDTRSAGTTQDVLR
ncbi:MAG: hypothetical protein ACPMAQ_17150, partial [Phycisphaerae bacterium]